VCFLLIIRNVSDKVVRKIKTILCSNFFSENRSFCEIIWENVAKSGGPKMIIRRMRIACWIKRLQTQTQNYKILTALVLQQWSQENFLVPRHTYTQPFLLTVLTFLFLLKYGDEGRIKAIEVCTYRTNVS